MRRSLLVVFVWLVLASVACQGELLASEVRGPQNVPLPASLAQNVRAHRVGPNTVSITPLNAQTYGHGAVMGASLEFANTPKWMNILAQIQPATHTRVLDLQQQIRSAPTADARAKVVGQLILFMENNPVLAAYATVEHLLLCDPTNTQIDPKRCSLPLRNEWDIWTSPSAPADVSALKIAHGTSSTLLQQSLLKSQPIGWSKPDVVGAPTALKWLEDFGRALNQGRATPDSRLKQTGDFINFGASYMQAPSGLVLDVKSTYSSSADLDALCAALKTHYGIHVFGVGSFVRPQIDGMKGGVTPVHFYHSHYAVLADGLSGTLRQGDVLMFNGASLLDESAGGFTVNQAQLSALAATQKQYNLHISFYTQEPALSPAAASVLVALSNQYPSIFLDGFAYGHLNGRAEKHTLGSGAGAQSPLFTAEKLALAARRAFTATKNAVVGAFSHKKADGAASAAHAATSAPGTLRQQSAASEVRGKFASMKARTNQGPLNP